MPGPDDTPTAALGGGFAIGPYSPGIRAGDFVFLSGQGGLDPETGEPVGDDIVAQTRQTMRNVAALLASGAMTTSDIVTVTCYLTDLADWPAMNEEYATHFDGSAPLPARTAIAVSALPKGLRLEITCVARVRR